MAAWLVSQLISIRFVKAKVIHAGQYRTRKLFLHISQKLEQGYVLVRGSIIIISFVILLSLV